MANNPKGLGKGLAALLGDDVIDSQEEKSSLFPVSYTHLTLPTNSLV